MSEQPNKVLPPDASGDVRERSTSAEHTTIGSTGLKLVTISPAQASIPDFEDTSRPGVALPIPERVDPYLGCTIDGRYKVEEVLGEGGMGVVYLCRHKIIGKKVAMKVLRADLARDSEATERFLNEARSASAIGNPHIIDISDFGQLPDGSTYFVMEYLEGKPLSQITDSGQPVPVPRILHIARQLAEALASAHHAGIVHRDLKPDNIFLVTRGSERDFVKILDFGIAKVSTVEGKLTRAGVVFGTPHYMSPEQAAGSPVDHRCDIYSLGVMLYEMAAGRVPFDADNFMGILTQHMYKAPVPIRALVPQPQEVPPGLEAIVLKCLSKRPEHRYGTMDELLAELEALSQGAIPSALPELMGRNSGFNVPGDYYAKTGMMTGPVPATPDAYPTRTRWPLYAGLAGVATAVVLVLAIFAKSSPSTASTSAAPVVTEPVAPPEPSPAPVASKLRVALAAEPIDAHVFRDGQDLGATPVLIELDSGSVASVEVRKPGYRTQVVELDGSENKRLVRLESEAADPQAAAAPAAPARTPRPRAAKAEPPKPAAKPKSSLGGGEIVNPWE